MRSARRAAIASVALAVASPAQEQRELRLVDCFALDSALVPEHAEPIAWIDAERLLIFAETERDGRRVKTFFAQHARDPQERAPFVDAGWLDTLAALPGLRRDDLAQALDEPDDFVWAKDWRGFVVDVYDDLFWYDRVHDVARRLTRSVVDEVGTQVSPDGTLVAFVAGHDLAVVSVDGGDVLELTSGGSEELLHGRLDWVYQEELYGRGNFQGFWWSPDSTRIALLRLDQRPVSRIAIPDDRPGGALHEEIRYPRAGEANPIVDLGVVDVAGGGVRWFDLAAWQHDDPLVVRVTWHPSGKELFFQVQDREQRWLEMVAGDSATAAMRTVFREDSPCWVEASSEPVWLRGGEEFLWRSERDGFAHLYRYKADGALVGRLTGGEFEVDEVLGVDESAGAVWYHGDGGVWRDQQLFRVGLAGGDAVRVTREDGWHEAKLAPDHRSFVDEWSRIDEPPTTTVRGADGAVLSTIAKGRKELLESFRLSKTRFVQIPARDGAALEAMIVEPRDFDPRQRHPVLLHQYSGPHTPRVLDRWRWRAQLWHQRMAQKGWLVFVVDCRTAGGKGRASACAGYRQLGRLELRDHEDALDWLIAQGWADPARIAIWGWSYGGYQTLFDMTHSQRFAAGVAVNPVTDWRFYDTIYTERYMATPQSNVAGYAASSVIEAAGQLHGEVLLVASTMDDNVHMKNSLELAWALQQAGKPFRFMPYPRVRHGIEDVRQQVHLFAEIESFLAEKVLPRR
ncbi:MAG: DPP IV N-terminal domain-containing protein [Planctomycetes bacterium]|nr:DPP IV N-terminal domain-containing protein [Planctomycetota bacterium]